MAIHLKSYIFIFSLFSILIFYLLFTFTFASNPNSKHQFSLATSTQANSIRNHELHQSNINKKYIPKTTKVTVAAVGDILIHSTVYKEAKTKDGYDFKPMLKFVKPILEKADIAIANQETMIGGTAMGLSTYPMFNSPYEVGDALKDAGIDVVTLANNHTLDRGEKAIQNAIQHWNKLNMPYVGSYISKYDQSQIRMITKNDITTSFLAYTYGTNGIPIPKEKPYLVNLINLENMKKEIALAKKQSDVVIVSLHFGNEYERIPNETQKNLVSALAKEGVDIILGHHPHVLQPMDQITLADGHTTFVVYSLGNFLSGQKGIDREIGGIVQVDVEKVIDKNGTKINIKKPSFVPTYVTRNSSPRFQIIPLQHAKQNGLKNAEQLYKETNSHMLQWITK